MAQKLQSLVTPEMAPLLVRAPEKESDAQIKALLVLACAQANPGSADPAARLAAVKALADTHRADSGYSLVCRAHCAGESPVLARNTRANAVALP